MDVLQSLVLGIIQGLTEFIPVSSSGHLVLAEHFLNSDINGFVFDAVVNFGTLAALILYLRHDIVALIKGFFRGGKERGLAILVIIATIPAVIAGLLMEHWAETTLRTPWVVVAALVAVGLAMLVVEKSATRRKDLEQITIKDSLVMGVAQVLAFFPGASRSGVTITAGLGLSIKRSAAARFSFLMSIPILAGGASKVLFESATKTEIANHLSVYLIGTLAAFISGYLAIGWLLNYLKSHALSLFAYYRFALAAVVALLLIAGVK